jgi:hypothetical protein
MIEQELKKEATNPETTELPRHEGPLQVFAFGMVTEDSFRAKVYSEIKQGRSRFGMWQQKRSLLDEPYGKHQQLLLIKRGDWIVHVNCPEYGRCVAAQAKGGYCFDAGIQSGNDADFCNYIPIDDSTVIEFDRNDPNVLPSVNLRPMKRIQRVLQVADFLRSLDNLKAGCISQKSNDLRGVLHLREKMSDHYLPEITKQIQIMNAGKDFELFLLEVFQRMPNCLATPNGFGWGTDNGADLLVEFSIPIVGITLTYKLVVQAKSYVGEHFDLHAVDQVVEGINKYEADGGLLISTARSTKQLEDYIQKQSEGIGKTIELIAGIDVARFVIRYAPDLLIGYSDNE